MTAVIEEACAHGFGMTAVIEEACAHGFGMAAVIEEACAHGFGMTAVIEEACASTSPMFLLHHARVVGDEGGASRRHRACGFRRRERRAPSLVDEVEPLD